jgi:hypothetical protein
MYLYLITRNDDGDYDQYDSAVVAAPDEATAKDLIERNSEYWTNHTWKREGESFKAEYNKLDITIELIGTAIGEMPTGVVVASFNAG